MIMSSLNYKQLFLISLLVFIATRFICLPDYPIYFFTDEAILTNQAQKLVERGFRDEQGHLLPAYFSTGHNYNTSLAVYLQVPGYLLFGKSIWVTRGTVTLISVLGALGTALLARRFFRCKHYWLVPFFLALAPSWFLHSRTAFDPVLMASFYPWFLYFYLKYLEEGGWNLIWSIFFGAATFYSYSAGQSVMIFSGILLALSDFRHHLRQWKQTLIAAGIVVLCAMPYLQFRLAHPEALASQLASLNSYWFENKPLIEKMTIFSRQYLYGLDPRFWFLPNEEGLARHQMKDYAHLMTWSAPFFAGGLVILFRRLRESSARALLIAIIVAPIGAALVSTGIVRILVFIVPATILISLCVNIILQSSWLRSYEKLVSCVLAFVLSAASFRMLTDALKNGPTWYTDYGMYQLQWGSRQLLVEAIPAYLKKYQPPVLFVSSKWANGVDNLIEFFDSSTDVSVLDITQFTDYYRPFQANSAFVLTNQQYNETLASNKFKPFSPDFILKFPNGEPGFIFVRLQYVDNVKELFSEDLERRKQLIQSSFIVLNQLTQVGCSPVDIGSAAGLFDGNTESVIRGKEANPFVVDLRFPKAQKVSSAAVYLRNEMYEITILAYPKATGKPLKFQAGRQISSSAPVITLDLGSIQLERLRIEVFAVNVQEPTCVHLFEIKLTP